MATFSKGAALSALIALVALPAGAGFVQVVEEADISLLSGADAQPEDIAVDAAGNIIVVDEGPSGNEVVLRFDQNGENGVLITDENAIRAALDAANGTDPLPSAFTINSVSVAADGDIVLTNGDGSAPDCLVTVANVASPAAITVVSCNVSGTPSPIEGCTSSTVISNTAYVAVNGVFGAAQDAILAVDTNDAGAPAAPATTLAGQASIEAATGASGGSANLGPMTTDGTLIWVADSAGSGTSDDIFTVNPVGGAVVLQVAATDVEADLGATDVGYTGLAVAANGSVWVGNSFGSGTGDDGVVRLTNVGGGTADAFLFPESQIEADLGAPGAGLFYGRAAFNPVTGQVLIANQNNGSPEGVLGVDQTLPVDLSTFAAD